MSKIKLVQNDTAPNIDIALVYQDTGASIDVSDPGDVVRLYFRPYNSETIKATIVASKPNGGADGVVRFSWGLGDLSDTGSFEGEIEITFNSGMVYTLYDKLKFTVREEIGP